ncbi:hypothetical protein N409_02725 [Helicobacter pylori FD719]|nr:hypothetical protein N409_02725 [Helicobacter pylori FD719]
MILIRAKNFRNIFFIFFLKPSIFQKMQTLCTQLLAFNENRANLLVFQKLFYSFDALCFA